MRHALEFYAVEQASSPYKQRVEDAADRWAIALLQPYWWKARLGEAALDKDLDDLRAGQVGIVLGTRGSKRGVLSACFQNKMDLASSTTRATRKALNEPSGLSYISQL